VKFWKEDIVISKPFCLNNKSLWKVSKVCCCQLVINTSQYTAVPYQPNSGPLSKCFQGPP